MTRVLIIFIIQFYIYIDIVKMKLHLINFIFLTILFSVILAKSPITSNRRNRAGPQVRRSSGILIPFAVCYVLTAFPLVFFLLYITLFIIFPFLLLFCVLFVSLFSFSVFLVLVLTLFLFSCNCCYEVFYLIQLLIGRTQLRF